MWNTVNVNELSCFSHKFTFSLKRLLVQVFVNDSSEWKHFYNKYDEEVHAASFIKIKLI